MINWARPILDRKSVSSWHPLDSRHSADWAHFAMHIFYYSILKGYYSRSPLRWAAVCYQCSWFYWCPCRGCRRYWWPHFRGCSRRRPVSLYYWLINSRRWRRASACCRAGPRWAPSTGCARCRKTRCNGWCSPGSQDRRICTACCRTRTRSTTPRCGSAQRSAATGSIKCCTARSCS